jgi:hypothetical protein
MKRADPKIMFNGIKIPLSDIVAKAKAHETDAHTIMDMTRKLELTRARASKLDDQLAEANKIIEKRVRGERERLPEQRESVTYHFKIFATEGTCAGYLTIGFYPDGRVGEVFFKLGKLGETVTGACDSWAIAVSMLLQMGMPLEAVIDKFRGTTFEPKGRTATPGIRACTSPVDFAMKYLDRRFVKKLPLEDDKENQK